MSVAFNTALACSPKFGFIGVDVVNHTTSVADEGSYFIYKRDGEGQRQDYGEGASPKPIPALEAAEQAFYANRTPDTFREFVIQAQHAVLRDQLVFPSEEDKLIVLTMLMNLLDLSTGEKLNQTLAGGEKFMIQTTPPEYVTRAS